MVRAKWWDSAGHVIRGLRKECAQSIIGATENRRDGSGLVATGLEPDFAVISFNVFHTGFGVFRVISASEGCDVATGLQRVANARVNGQRTQGQIVKPATQALFA